MTSSIGRRPATLLLGTLAAFAIGLFALRPGSASDHQDTISMVNRPGADITDLYVFPAANPDNVVFALNVHPLIPRGMGTTAHFDPGVMYQIKIDTVGDYREHMVLQFKATGTDGNQRITLYRPSQPKIGMLSTFGTPLGSTAYGKVARFADGTSFFAGPRRDPFYFDLTQFFRLFSDRNYKNHPNPPPPSATCFRAPGQNFLADFNVLSLVVEMPRRAFETSANGGRINLWATTSVADSGIGNYHQIERWGRPAVKELFETFADHSISNAAEPYDDPTLSSSIRHFMVTPKPYGAGRSSQIGAAMVKVLMPDEMQVDLKANGHATYLGVETKGLSGLPVGVVRVVPDAGLKGLKGSLRNGAREFGGRDPDSPVIDLSLGAVYGSIVPKVGLAPDDHKETQCLTSDNTKPAAPALGAFPYLAASV